MSVSVLAGNIPLLMHPHNLGDFMCKALFAIIVHFLIFLLFCVRDGFKRPGFRSAYIAPFGPVLAYVIDRKLSSLVSDQIAH